MWLKNYVYFRLYTEEEIRGSPAKANVSQYVTFIVSALWHGFYPSYYVGFISTALLNQLSKYLFKSFTYYQPILDKFYLFQNPLYILTRYILTTHFLNFCGIIFQLLDLKSIGLFMANMNYDVTIINFLLCLFFGLTQFGQRRPRKVETK